MLQDIQESVVLPYDGTMGIKYSMIYSLEIS